MNEEQNTQNVENINNAEQSTVDTVNTNVDNNVESKEVDKSYRLEEMYDEMAQSIHNVSVIIEQQTYLIDKLTSLNDDKFTILIQQLQAQLEQYKSQLPLLEERCNKLNIVINACKQDTNIKEVILNFVDALGMFKNN